MYTNVTDSFITLDKWDEDYYFSHSVLYENVM